MNDANAMARGHEFPQDLPDLVVTNLLHGRLLHGLRKHASSGVDTQKGSGPSLDTSGRHELSALALLDPEREYRAPALRKGKIRDWNCHGETVVIQ